MKDFLKEVAERHTRQCKAMADCNPEQVMYYAECDNRDIPVLLAEIKRLQEYVSIECKEGIINMKVYAKIDSLYGEETRVVIETTRESWNLTLEEAKALYNQLEASIESIERFTS